MTKKYKNIPEKSANQDHIEGIRAVMEALEHKAPLKQIFLDSNIKNAGKITQAASYAGVPCKYVSRQFLDEHSTRGSHQGVIASVERYKYANLKDVLSAETSKAASLVLILDHIKDAGNLGAIIRSAEAAGAACVIIPNKRSASVNVSTYKTSAGAVTHIDVVQVSNISAAIDALKRAGYWICAASEHANDQLWDANLKGKIALVMGSENSGISPLVLKNCDFTIKMPILGSVESLNVAQACTVCAYEWVRQNRDNLEL